MLFELVLMGVFCLLWIRTWDETSSMGRITFWVVVVSAIIGWLGQFLGFSEVIEFDAREIRIRKERLGWERRKQYPIGECSDLKMQDESGSPHGLEFRFGRWRTIEIADALTPEQAINVIAALQESLPDVAQNLLPSLDITRHFTKLGLE